MIFTVDVELDAVMANPWQPRTHEDGEHIKQLALSIAADGLMQVPVGRLVDADGNPCAIDEALYHAGPVASVGEAWAFVFRELGCRVQLAFGHSRLAAYRWLRDVKENSNLVGDWSRIPVGLRDLGDEEMYRLGISENLQRKDLSPIEEARAMLRYRDEFGKTSAEIGELFGLAESSVRNKMRLVGLPVEIQQLLSEGKIGEGVAREMIRFYELPEEMRDERIYWNGKHGTTIFEAVNEGIPADMLRENIGTLIKRQGRNLAYAIWELDRRFDLAMDGEIKSEMCKGCALTATQDKGVYCLATLCWHAKQNICKREFLARASAATGIRAGEIEMLRVNMVDLDKEHQAEIRASGCENLCLIYVDQVAVYETGMVIGHPHVRVVCAMRNGQCRCARGIKARKQLASMGMEAVSLQKEGSPVAAVSYQPEKKSVDNQVVIMRPGPDKELPGQMQISANSADLAELARQERRMKRQLVEEVKAIQEDFAHRLVVGFENRNSLVMARALLRFMYSTEVARHEGAMPEEILLMAMMKIAQDVFDIESNPIPNVGYALRQYNQWLKRAGLAEMTTGVKDEPVYTALEPEVEVERPLNGKTLMDVFQEPGGVEKLLPGQKDGELLTDYFRRVG